MSDDPNIIALISRSLAQTARSRLLSWAGRFGLVPSTTLSPSVRRGYAQSSMGVLSTRIPPSDCRGGRGAGGGMDGDGERGGRE